MIGLTLPFNPVIGVAIRGKNLTICLPAPNRHSDCFYYAKQVLHINCTKSKIGVRAIDQGFYLADGTFLNREEAWQHVKKIGQVREPGIRKYLFSEDVWV